jgi:hypothetical protein
MKISIFASAKIPGNKLLGDEDVGAPGKLRRWLKGRLRLRARNRKCSGGDEFPARTL